MKKIFILIPIIVLALSSCEYERTIYLDDIPITPHLVLNSLVGTDSDTAYFYITESVAIYSGNASPGVNDYVEPDYPIIEDADFSLTVNGEKRSIEYNYDESAYILVGKLHEGDRVDVAVKHKNREIRSEAVLPAAPEIISLDIDTVTRIENGYYPEDYIKFELRIKDHPGRKDYYRLLVNNDFYFLEDGTPEQYIYYVVPYYTNDPVLTEGYNGTVPETSTGVWHQSFISNYYSVFRDALFAGEEYTLTFFVLLDSYAADDGRRIAVRLQTISEDLYKYYSSLQRNLQTGMDNVSEPAAIHTNIIGGLGILGACNEVKAFEYKNF
jgi:hypothetical protein